jgi:hypothetical protein
MAGEEPEFHGVKQEPGKDAAEPTNQYPTSGGYRFGTVAGDPKEHE